MQHAVPAVAATRNKRATFQLKTNKKIGTIGRAQLLYTLLAVLLKFSPIFTIKSCKRFRCNLYAYFDYPNRFKTKYYGI